MLSKGAILGDVHDIKAEKVVPGVTLCAFETSYHPSTFKWGVSYTVYDFKRVGPDRV